jgi:hypothetical protein
MTETTPQAPVTRWRKPPVTVEAVRWTGDNYDEIVEFTGCANFDVVDPEDRGDDPDTTAQVLDKLHSTWVHVYDGQWIVKGVKGEFCPIADDVLRETYESADGSGETGAVSPGQAFRTTLHERWAARGRPIDLRPWEALPGIDREDLEAAAKAARKAVPPVDREALLLAAAMWESEADDYESEAAARRESEPDSARLADAQASALRMCADQLRAALDAALTASDDGTLTAAGHLADVMAERDKARTARDEYRDNAILHIRERDEAIDQARAEVVKHAERTRERDEARAALAGLRERMTAFAAGLERGAGSSQSAAAKAKRNMAIEIRAALDATAARHAAEASLPPEAAAIVALAAPELAAVVRGRDEARERLDIAEQEAIDLRDLAVETFALIAVLADGNRPAQRKANELRKRAGLLPSPDPVPDAAAACSVCEGAGSPHGLPQAASEFAAASVTAATIERYAAEAGVRP